jgi:hypothetical protein
VLYLRYVKKLYTILLLIFNSYSAADDLSVNEMVDFIVKEQFISQQEDSIKNSMYTMLESFGMNIQSEAMDDFLDPLIGEYLKSVATKVPALYKDLYSDDEILALYNFMNTEEGIANDGKNDVNG